MSTSLSAWFSTQGFMPHGHCYLWNPALVWLHVVSDSLIFLAYVAIPAALVYLVRRRNDLPFDWIFVCFGVFIVSCGMTHFMEVWTLWNPSYWVSGAIKAVTALASVCTAALLVHLTPKAIALPSPSQLQRVAAALEASEARFRAAVEGSRDSFCILDAQRDAQGEITDFSYVYLNARARSRIPLEGEIVGKRISELFPATPLHDFFAHCLRVMKDGKPVDDEIVLRLPGQAPRWLSMQIVPLGAGVAVTARDISERKRDEAALKRAEERFRGLLESAPDAMVIVEQSGRIVFANAQTERLFGYEIPELLDQPVEVLLPPGQREGHVALRTGYFADPQRRAMGAESELRARRKDGSEFPVEISLSPLQTDAGLLVSSAIRDVTQRRQTEDALKLANHELEAFSYSVAHDLRAPLRGMSGFAQILTSDHAERLDEEGRDCLLEIQQNAQRMGELIDALLSLSRVARSELRLERVNLSALAQSVANDLARAEPERAVQVDVQSDITATMDQALARTLLSNVIGNAWKFTKREAAPRIEVGLSSGNGQPPALFVRDNGAGFDMQFANKLFAPFQRLHMTQDYPGTGIGLATVQRIVQRHGGRVWAESQQGAGATFYLRLPIHSQGARV